MILPLAWDYRPARAQSWGPDPSVVRVATELERFPLSFIEFTCLLHRVAFFLRLFYHIVSTRSSGLCLVSTHWYPIGVHPEAVGTLEPETRMLWSSGTTWFLKEVPSLQSHPIRGRW